MGQISMKLSVRRTNELRVPGRYADGNGLYLHIRKGGSRQWILRTTVQGKRCDIGLGSPGYVSLAEARERAYQLRKEAKAGGDPLAQRRDKDSIPTFEKAARTVWEQNKGSWKNPKHAQQWINTLEDYAFPKIGRKKVNEMTPAHIINVLTPIWTTKAETARRVRQRLKAVFDWSKASGFREESNPVEAVKVALPKQTDKVRHHTALPWKELPEFMAKLRDHSAVSARALEFLILTATRSGEAREARIDEIKDGVWTVPSERMKMKKEHRVPLSKEAKKVVKSMKGHSERWLFPNEKDKPLSNMVFKSLFVRMGYSDLTAHGFRSTFRDWVADNDGASREVAETALAHRVGGDTERAYARSDMFERRRVMGG